MKIGDTVTIKWEPLKDVKAHLVNITEDEEGLTYTVRLIENAKDFTAYRINSILDLHRYELEELKL